MEIEDFARWFKCSFLKRAAGDREDREKAPEEMQLPGGGWKQMTVGMLDEEQNRFAMRLPPPTEGELYNHSLEDYEYCWVMVFPNEAHEKHKAKSPTDISELKTCREESVRALKRAGLSLIIELSWDSDEYYVKIGAPQRFLEYYATKVRMPIKCIIDEKTHDGRDVECFRPFDMMQRDKFIGNRRNAWFAFRTKPRLQLVDRIIRERWDTTLPACSGAGLKPNEMRKKGRILHYFPRHEEEKLKALEETWARFGLMHDMTNGMWHQPIDQIAAYFGEKLAMYFKFLGYYTFGLVSPMLWGLVAFGLALAFGSGSFVANWADVGYSIQIMFWSTLLLENWKREESTQAHRWGMRDLEKTAQPLAEFRGEWDPVLETLISTDSEDEERRQRFCVGGVLCGLIILIVAFTMGFFTALEAYVNRTTGMGSAVSYVTAILIIVFNYLYQLLAAALTDMENHRTEVEYQDNLTLKCFIFQFINSYFVLYITAFGKPFSEAGHGAGVYNGVTYNATAGNYLGDTFGTCSCTTYLPSGCYSASICNDVACSNVPAAQCQCTKFDCRSDVGYTLAVLFGVQIFIGNLSEVFVPLFYYRFKEYLADGAQDQSENKFEMEKEAMKANYEEYVYAGLFDDYNELALQFGFVTLFASNFPLVGTLAFLNNIIEIRSDAYKFLHTYRRPVPRNCENIGTWFYVLEMMTFAAITTNLANIFLVSELSQELDWASRIVYLFGCEHIAFMVKILLSASIADVPREIARDIDIEASQNKKAAERDILRIADDDFADEMATFLNDHATLEEIPLDWPLEPPPKNEENASLEIKVEQEPPGMGAGVAMIHVPPEDAPAEAVEEEAAPASAAAAEATPADTPAP